MTNMGPVASVNSMVGAPSYSSWIPTRSLKKTKSLDKERLKLPAGDVCS